MSLPPARASTSKGTSSETENPVIMAKKIDKLCERIIDNYVDSPDLSVRILNLTIFVNKFQIIYFILI